jgi:hypothetical protein
MAKRRHFLISGTNQPIDYTATGGGSGKFKTPPRDGRKEHGEALIKQIRNAEKEADETLSKEKVADGIDFVPIQVESSPEFELWLDSLEDARSGIDLVNVQEKGDKQIATVHLPKDKVDRFIRRFDDFIHKDTEKGKPRDWKLAEGINEIRLATLRGSYWTDSGPVPANDVNIWWEVWLRDEGQIENIETSFRDLAAQEGVRLSDARVAFPERIVLLAYTSLDKWSEFPGLLKYLAEFRRAEIVSREFIELEPADQMELIEGLLARTTFAGQAAPSVCILDGGVNRGHPLLAPALSEENNLAWHEDWTSADQHGHGTEMAGLALFGPLERLLRDEQSVTLEHRLEAVKVLPDDGENDAPDYGPITVGSVSKIVEAEPNRPRVVCIAVTASDKDEWLPTLWSASIDQMCSGANDPLQRCLMLVSAGNLFGEPGKNYPDENLLASVQDPAQSWNVLTVGACTEKAMIEDPDLAGWNPVALPGGLCPASTTSVAWDGDEWPFKPDIVMEGGNYAKDEAGNVFRPDDLSMTTTSFSTDGGALLSDMGDTSGATALAARMAATLYAEYPTYWPETIRALMVHSARWTPQMRKDFVAKKKRDLHQRLRCYGYGVPSLARARLCAKNSATLVIQESIQPFHMVDKKVETKEMHLHSLPWPKEVLRELGDTELLMRVTLSYFVEPSPGRRGWHTKHRYQSHGLRFDVRRPLESMKQFQERLTRDAWEDGQRPAAKRVKESRKWILGEKLRTRGSLHSDWWKGSAADLAASEFIAIYPVTGWWRERPSRGSHSKRTRYSLIVSIESADGDVELYAAVETAIRTETTITLET